MGNIDLLTREPEEESSDMPVIPNDDTLAMWLDEGGCQATDGCWVEPDGYCEHGFPSWLLYLGLM